MENSVLFATRHLQPQESTIVHNKQNNVEHVGTMKFNYVEFKAKVRVDATKSRHTSGLTSVEPGITSTSVVTKVKMLKQHLEINTTLKGIDKSISMNVPFNSDELLGFIKCMTPITDIEDDTTCVNIGDMRIHRMGTYIHLCFSGACVNVAGRLYGYKCINKIYVVIQHDILLRALLLHTNLTYSTIPIATDRDHCPSYGLTTPPYDEEAREINMRQVCNGVLEIIGNRIPLRARLAFTDISTIIEEVVRQLLPGIASSGNICVTALTSDVIGTLVENKCINQVGPELYIRAR